MTIQTKAQTLTKAVLDVLQTNMSMGQIQSIAPNIEAAINAAAAGLDAIEIEAESHSSTLGEKFQALLKAMMPRGCPDQQALFAQAFFLGGAHSAFQILAHANTKTPEESLVIWQNLQKDIRSAAPKKENAVQEKRIVSLH